MRLREGKLVSEWKDEHGNRALIEEVEIKPHKEAKLKKAYRLSCYAEYDDNFCYHISIFDSVESAENQLKKFSCGTFKDTSIISAENIICFLKIDYKTFITFCKNEIERIKNRKEISSEEKMALNIILKACKIYIGDLADNFVIDYNELKILYTYLEKIASI